MVAMPRDTLEFNQITSMKCSRRPFRMNHMITSGWTIRQTLQTMRN